MGKTTGEKNTTINPAKRGKKGNAPTPQGGRPRVIDLGDEELNEMARLVSIHCTKEEVCGVMLISEATLDRRLADHGIIWKDFYNHHMAGGRGSLRRWLWEGAENGCATRQIWLSKQELGMKDRAEHGFDPDKPAVFRLAMGKQIEKGDQDDG